MMHGAPARSFRAVPAGVPGLGSRAVYLICSVIKSTGTTRLGPPWRLD